MWEFPSSPLPNDCSFLAPLLQTSFLSPLDPLYSFVFTLIFFFQLLPSGFAIVDNLPSALSVASSSVTPSLYRSSFTTSTNFLCGLHFCFLPDSFMFSILCIYILLCMCMYVCTCVCVYIHVHVHTCTYVM